MKSAQPNQWGKLTSGRACAVYVLTFVLMLLLDAGRFSAFLDRVSVDFPPAATVSRWVRNTAEASGLRSLSEAGTRLVAEWSTEKIIGAVEEVPEAEVPMQAGTLTVAEKELHPEQVPTPPLPESPAEKPLEAAPASLPEVREEVPVTPIKAEAEPVMEEEKAPAVEKKEEKAAEETQPVSVEQAVVPAVQPATAEPAAVPAVQPALPKPEEAKPALPEKEEVRKQHVLLAGDSMMESIAAILQRELKRPGLTVTRKGKYSTGLTRPDFYDWPAELEKLVRQYDPDEVVLFIGANDPQDIVVNRKRYHCEDEGWGVIYRQRAEELLRVAMARGARVVWIGLPIMGKSPYDRKIRRLSLIHKEVCEAMGAHFVDSYATLADKNGGYQSFMVDDKGRRIRLRRKDKIHMTDEGSRMLVKQALPFIEEALSMERMTPPALLGGEQSFSVKSELRGEEVPCLAYLPRTQAEGERFPVVYMLHGAVNDASAWKEAMGQQLADMAETLRLVLVAPSGGIKSWYADSPLQPLRQSESFLFRELMPYVESHFPVQDKKSVMGMSMGGHGAVTLALRHPGTFVSVSSMSGVLDITRHPEQWGIKDILGAQEDNPQLWMSYSSRYQLKLSAPEDLPPLLITIGAQDEEMLPENHEFRDALQAMKADFQYRESEGGHNWMYWVTEVPRHLEFHAARLHGAK